MIPTLKKSRQEMWTSIAIFAVLLVFYTYTFPRWADPNQNSRLDLVVAVASGQLSKSETLGAGEAEFAPWYLGAML